MFPIFALDTEWLTPFCCSPAVSLNEWLLNFYVPYFTPFSEHSYFILEKAYMYAEKS